MTQQVELLFVIAIHIIFILPVLAALAYELGISSVSSNHEPLNSIKATYTVIADHRNILRI